MSLDYRWEQPIQESPAPAQQAPAFSIHKIIFAAVLLPFTRPIRTLACGLVPAIILLLGSLAFPGITIFPGPSLQVGPIIVDPLRLLLFAPWLVKGIWLASFAILACWLCAWQRDVVSDSRDGIGPWLSQSLKKAPGYLGALAAWYCLPMVIYLIPIGIYWLFTGHTSYRFNVTPGFIPIASIAVLLILIPGIWLMTRLSLFPAAAAAFGWKRTFRKSWQLGKGHGLRLFCIIFVLAVLSFAVSWLLGRTEMDFLGTGNLRRLANAVGISNFVGTALGLLWITSATALAFKTLNPIVEEIDLDAFN
jgi:hypothetical protein